MTGLPKAVIPIGGPIDVAFVGGTAYVLVAHVGDDVPGSTRNDIDGIYRVDGPTSVTVIADIGDWSLKNPPPPEIDFFLTRGVPFAMEPVRGGFLVTDGHDSGELLAVARHGGFDVVAENLDRPTSVAFQGGSAFVTTLDGEVWKIDDVTGAKGIRHGKGCAGGFGW